MIKRKPLLFLALMIAIVAVFTASEVVAGDQCAGDFTVTFDSVRLGSNGGHIYKYIFTGGSLSISKLSFVEFAIDANLTVVTTEKVAYHAPLEGGQNGWAEYVPQVGIVTITPQVNQGIAPVEFEVKGTAGQVGIVGMRTKAGNSFDGCGIDGPSSGDVAPQTEGINFSQKVSTPDGEKTCEGTVYLEPTFNIELTEPSILAGCAVNPDTYDISNILIQTSTGAHVDPASALALEEGWFVTEPASPGETCYFKKKCDCYKCYTY